MAAAAMGCLWHQVQVLPADAPEQEVRLLQFGLLHRQVVERGEQEEEQTIHQAPPDSQ